MGMLNRRGDKRSDEVGNTPQPIVEVKLTTHNAGQMLNWREAMYRKHVLTGTPIQWPTMRTLSFLSSCLYASKSLYISVQDVMKLMHLSVVVMHRCTVAEVMNDLSRHGLLHRSTRKAVRGSRLTVTYGMTARGKAMLELYFAYLAGEHDDKLPL